VANQKSKRSRKARGKSGVAPRAVPSQRREQRAEREAVQQRQSRQASRTLGSIGERPESPFGGLPISEFAIFVGIVGLIIGAITGEGTAIAVAALVCGLGVVEITAREHFTGFRSHATLLAAVPAVIVEGALNQFVAPLHNNKALLLPVIPVFTACFWLRRKSFARARHARVTRPPAS
jgi:hypothetical protein